ncbi:hypothetical protein PROFUN_03191 [Planoprotostelium fungivorum]|uniref:Uncharacterized protein n=1 Tax=Planoprotostelium fungivorum TaxID=1890364 RepID=A0A2P6NWY1_9EUKA|nr:hypothetical protein PROFUN_03191 [Planoprotostelium fungivorum]
MDHELTAFKFIFSLLLRGDLPSGGSVIDHENDDEKQTEFHLNTLWDDDQYFHEGWEYMHNYQWEVIPPVNHIQRARIWTVVRCVCSSWRQIADEVMDFRYAFHLSISECLPESLSFILTKRDPRSEPLVNTTVSSIILSDELTASKNDGDPESNLLAATVAYLSFECFIILIRDGRLTPDHRLIELAISSQSMDILSWLIDNVSIPDNEQNFRAQMFYAATRPRNATANVQIGTYLMRDSRDLFDLFLDHPLVDPNYTNDLLIQICHDANLHKLKCVLEVGRVDPGYRDSQCLFELIETKLSHMEDTSLDDERPAMLEILLKDGRADPTTRGGSLLRLEGWRKEWYHTIFMEDERARKTLLTMNIKE